MTARKRSPYRRTAPFEIEDEIEVPFASQSKALVLGDGWTVATLHEHYSVLRQSDEHHVERFERERDRRYTERDAGNTARLMAVITTNEKALGLLAEQQREYKTASNEWRATLNDLINRMMSRSEIEGTLGSITSKLDTTFETINKKIDIQHGELVKAVAALQQVNVKDIGKDEGLELARKNQRYIIGLAIGVPGLVLAIAGVVALFR